MVQRIRRMKGEEGLTLIEILVVLIILGILSGLVIFGIATFREDTAEVACQTDGKSVETASEAYRARNPGYAAELEADIVGGGYLKASEDIEVNTMTKDGYTITYAAGGIVKGQVEGGPVGGCYDSEPPAP